ncbi:MAG TPA: hypothetical protein VF625_17195 [Longimicrobium sp.]|jgi:hypothetical protein
MEKRIDTFIYRDEDGLRFANSLILGGGLQIGTTEGGIPELLGSVGELVLHPSGGNDINRIQAALDTPGVAHVRLGPGTFNIGLNTLNTNIIRPRPGQRISGSGMDLTTLVSTDYGILEMVAGNTVDSLSLDGLYIGGGLPADTSIHRLDSVRISNTELGLDIGGNWVITNVVLRDIAGSAIEMVRARAVIQNMTVTNASGGVVLDGGVGSHVSDLTMTDCAGGLTVRNGVSVELSTVSLLRCASGFAIENTGTAVINACSVREYNSTGAGAATLGPLRITGGNNITVNAFGSQMTASAAGSPPHVLVSGGATQVVFTSVIRFNGSSAPATEVNVSGAGGRVLFLQQNFDPAKINSGGKYVAL